MYPAGAPDVSARLVLLTSGLRVRIAECGPPEGRPTLLLHGWAASMYTYRYLMPVLADEGRRVVALDFRGHGLSEKPTARGAYTLQALMEDVLALLDALQWPAVDLVGHSMGGAVALHIATLHAARVSRLALINPAGLTRIWTRQVAAALSPHVLDLFARELTPRWVIRTVLRWTYAKPDRLTEHDVDEYWAPSQFPGYFHAARMLLRHFDWRPVEDQELSRLQAPTMVLLGAEDRVIPDGLAGAARLREADVVELADAGHLCVEELPDAANAAVLEFLGAARPA